MQSSYSRILQAIFSGAPKRGNVTNEQLMQGVGKVLDEQAKEISTLKKELAELKQKGMEE